MDDLWAGFTLALALALAPVPASAHPLGDDSTDCFVAIEVAPETTVLHQVVALAEIPTEEERPFIDVDGNDHITARELDDYADEMAGRFQPGLELIVNGQPEELTVGRAEGFISPGEGSHDVLRIEVDHVADALDEGDEVEFTDATCPQHPGWKEVVLYATRGAIVSGSSVPAYSASSQLRDFPADGRPSAVTSATFTVGGVGEEAADAGSPLVGLVSGVAVLGLVGYLLARKRDG